MKRVIADPILPTQVRNISAGLVQLEQPDNLLRRELGLRNRPFSGEDRDNNQISFRVSRFTSTAHCPRCNYERSSRRHLGSKV
jgi:hypothetical protein